MKSVVHEIRNHLAVAVANIEAFRDGVLEPNAVRLGAVLQALGEVDVLLREVPIAGVARLSVKPRAIDVCGVITNAVLAFEGTAAEHGVEFVVRACEVRDISCARFFGDPMRIAEIVNNVLSNAIRYTPRGGRIEVDCRRAGGVLVLTVNDDGPGIPQDEVGHIFERGFRGAGSSASAGLGVGLALAKRFVEEHGGSIEVAAGEPHGAHFTVRLPGVFPTTESPAETARLL